MQNAQDDYILPKYLPDGCILTQYHHIRLDDADALLIHWTQRQADGEVPLRFKNLPMAKREGRANTPTPAGRTDQQEGGQQDTSSHQSNGEDQGDGTGVASNV